MVNKVMLSYKHYFKHHTSYHHYQPIWCRSSYAYHTSTLTFLFAEMKKHDSNLEKPKKIKRNKSLFLLDNI